MFAEMIGYKVYDFVCSKDNIQVVVMTNIVWKLQRHLCCNSEEVFLHQLKKKHTQAMIL